jgi:glutamine amidotransferase PdxT
MTSEELYDRLRKLGFQDQAPIKWNEFVMNFGNLILPGSESVTIRMYKDETIVKFYSSHNFGTGIGAVNGDSVMLEDLTEELLIECICDVSPKFKERIRNNKIGKILEDE